MSAASAGSTPSIPVIFVPVKISLGPWLSLTRGNRSASRNAARLLIPWRSEGLISLKNGSLHRRLQEYGRNEWPRLITLTTRLRERRSGIFAKKKA